jgi:hypothetical protein
MSVGVRARFVHVGIHYSAAEVPLEEIEILFSKALDWVRYDAHCWILYTSSELHVWRDRLKKILSQKDHFFLCEFEPVAGEGYAGWMKQDIWDWINSKKAKS